MPAVRSKTIEELVRDQSFIEDPYPVYATILNEAPIWETPDGEKVFARHRDVREILRDPDRFGQSVKQHKMPSFVMLDPPDHTRLRGLVSKGFTPRAISKMREDIQRASDDLLRGLHARGRMELVADYARPLPTRMITDMLGIPLVDAPRWEQWANTIHRSTAAISYLPDQKAIADELRTAAQEASAMEVEYFSELIAARKAEPPRDDVLGALMSAEEQGDSLSDVELRYTLVLLLGAGHHTSVNLITNGLWALLSHPEQFRLLRNDRSLLPVAIEEMIRWDGIVQITRRRARVASEVDGIPIAEDEVVTCLVGAANRDPQVFENPDDFDITRANTRLHLGFGFGIHHCLGSTLARAEATVAFNALLDLPWLSLTDETLPTHGSGYGLRGIERLEIEWEAD